MTLFNETGRNTPAVIVTKDEDETMWEMATLADAASYLRDAAQYGEYEVIGIYQLELSNTGGAVAPIPYEVLAGDNGVETVRFHPDQQDPVELSIAPRS